jgi:type IV secretion system protein VirB5
MKPHEGSRIRPHDAHQPKPARPTRRRSVRGMAVALGMILAAACVRAGGIPVIDAANLASAIQQLQSSITQINNQYQQIRHLYDQVNAISRARGLGDVLNNPLLHDYIPREAGALVRQIEQQGYAGLSGAARALRDAEMVYNCLDLDGAPRVRCQAALARPYQGKAFMDAALQAARQRSAQINELMRRAGTTLDLKEAAELNARITAEGALLQHEVSQIQLIRGLAEADERIATAQAREAQLQQATRTRRLANFWNATP